MNFDFTKEPGKHPPARKLNCNGEPIISIITPFYNAGKYFQQTFYSVIGQTFPWFEWIITDDGTNDSESVALLEKLSRQDKRIRLLHQDNQGQSAARNLAAKCSTGELLVPLDADDLIAPPFLEELYWAMRTHPNAGWAYTDSVGFDGQEYVWQKPFSSARMKTENILVCTAAIRRSVFEKAGGYDASVKHYDEDWHLWLRLLALGIYPVHVKGFLFWYRRHADGMQATVQSEQCVREISMQKIRQAASLIKQEVQAVELPRGNPPGAYSTPVCAEWARRIFPQHEKIHVMMLLPWMEMGGADLFNLDICRLIDKDKFEIAILTTMPAENSWRQRFEEYITDIFTLPDFLETADFPEFISYFIQSREIDVLFLSNSYYGYYLIPWLREQFPTLAIIDYVHMEEWYWRNGGFARTSGAMGEILEKTYVCNERTRQVLVRDFGRSPESVETLYIGVDQNMYAADTVESGLMRAALGIALERPVILFPCRIHPQKRPFLMLEIAREVKRSISNIAFVVVGDGPQFEELRVAVSRENLQDVVYLAGRQDDLRPYYQDCALTLICSLKEGLALTAYESLAMGKPVVTSDVGGQAELIDSSVGRVLPLLQNESNDLDCRAFSAEEVRQYAEAITDILSNREAWETMCTACRRRIEEGFSSQHMAARLGACFAELVQQGERKLRREQTAAKLAHFRRLFHELPILYSEIEAYEAMYKNSFVPDTKNELMRIANSKWGSRLIRLAFRFKLNRLFK